MQTRPNLSLERLALTLAALGTSAVVTACTRAEPAGGARADQAPTSSASSPPPPQPTQVMPDEAQKSEGEREPVPAQIATTTATPPPTASAHRMAPGKKPDKGGTGQASCGAGTCTADPKKK